LLVERISIPNALWQTKFACIISAKEQFDAKTIDQNKFHGGKLNYLMLDGHVELLRPIQSGGHVGAGNQGLWTIRPGD
jgi:prepilin-type processing-associated H-X9-DG protein